jgi:RNA polymerase sigma factor (TIGR02999 family)
MRTRITLLLERMRAGEHEALDELMPLVIVDLRRIARSFMRRQRPGHTLQPTALINEAFLRLFGDEPPAFADRAHLLALCSRIMRQLLVDHARATAAAKRGGDDRRVPWDTQIEVQAEDGSRDLNVLDLHSALERLEREHPSMAQAVEMHYFAGMTAEEAAAATGRSVHVVRHDLRLARAWLRRELARLPADPHLPLT